MKKRLRCFPEPEYSGICNRSSAFFYAQQNVEQGPLYPGQGYLPGLELHRERFKASVFSKKRPDPVCQIGADILVFLQMVSKAKQ